MLKAHFRRFLEAEPGRLHFAAHSHHPWPDVTFAAQQEAWLDAARWADEKWRHIFGSVIPEAQRRIAAELNLPSPESLVFAPNTHELVLRLLSCLPERPRVLTTDSEFHSFERQTRRLEEEGLISIERVATEPFASFAQRFLEAASSQKPQLVFFSHVFFNSGFIVPELASLVRALPADALVCVDGYHGFCAVPTDLSLLASRAFYVAGGYKYAMAGEGACFLHVPSSAAELRPRNTGWFAAFGALEEKQEGRVPYAPGGARFFGATFDVSGLYRLNAALRWRAEAHLTTEKTRAHAHALQRRFLEALPSSALSRAELVVPEEARRGQFLTFRTPDARALSEALAKKRVITDARDDRLRFGFGPYQDEADVDALVERLR
ncbi:MAG: aminotransferase class V-fold PLP-dependent enzyme [Myxococcota bacterium]